MEKFPCTRLYYTDLPKHFIVDNNLPTTFIFSVKSVVVLRSFPPPRNPKLSLSIYGPKTSSYFSVLLSSFSPSFFIISAGF